MARKNEGKPRISLIFLFPYAVRALVKVITKEGAEKYGPPEDRGWLSYDPSETLDSLTRHLESVMCGNDEDIDNVIFNAMVYKELVERKRSNPFDVPLSGVILSQIAASRIARKFERELDPPFERERLWSTCFPSPRLTLPSFISRALALLREARRFFCLVDAW